MTDWQANILRLHPGRVVEEANSTISVAVLSDWPGYLPDLFDRITGICERAYVDCSRGILVVLDDVYVDDMEHGLLLTTR